MHDTKRSPIVRDLPLVSGRVRARRRRHEDPPSLMKGSLK